MNTEEFRDLLQHRTDSQLLDTCLRNDATPFVFEPLPAAWDLFRGELAAGLGVAGADIRVVGSGRLGFSMKPGHALRAFRDTSDIDVVVVNPEAFDRLWLALLAVAYPRPPNTGGRMAEKENERGIYGMAHPTEDSIGFEHFRCEGKTCVGGQRTVVRYFEEGFTSPTSKARGYNWTIISELGTRRAVPSA